MYYYDTVSEAVNDMRNRGFLLDFNLQENCLVCNNDRFHIEDFEVEEVYRFEGQTDPADEAIVFGISSLSGVKGILVSGYGISAEGMSAEMAKKLSLGKR
ncbi:MAG TPA: hypothetical protein VFV31_09385 [Chitinophagaceae bacterium]|nr:hypothetical protein [Chitinophagaceae bacterium]